MQTTESYLPMQLPMCAWIYMHWWIVVATNNDLCDAYPSKSKSLLTLYIVLWVDLFGVLESLLVAGKEIFLMFFSAIVALSPKILMPISSNPNLFQQPLATLIDGFILDVITLFLHPHHQLFFLRVIISDLEDRSSFLLRS